MFLQRRRQQPASRGQAMVEFALILPLLALLLVMALDFGRIFFGSIALHNAARIGANDAAVTPDAWSESDLTRQAVYRERIEADLEAINCEYQDPIPDPTFSNRVGTADPHEIGDHVTVTLTCDFSLITPLAESIVGSPVTMAAAATFPVRGGVIEGVATGPTPPPPNCTDFIVPNLVGLSVSGARFAWTNAGFTGAFTPDTGFDTETVTLQTTTPASNPGDCMPATTLVTVDHEPPATCSGGELPVPNLLGLTVDQARSEWTGVGFTGSFTPDTGFDTEVVETQTTSSGADPGECADPSVSVTVTHAAPVPPAPQCIAPDLFGRRVNDISDADFDPNWTGQLIITRPPNGNYQVATQSLVAGQAYDCSIDMEVYGS